MQTATPPSLPPKIDYVRLITQIGEAHAALGKLNGLLVNIPNLELLISPLLTKEAVLSSKIEGTRATVEDVYRYEAEGKETENDDTEQDIREIMNYRQAIQQAMDGLKDNPIDIDLIHNMHQVLLNSVRGSGKTPGLLRETQVFIGTSTATIETASYVPPAPETVPDLLVDWANYMNGSLEKDPLVQIGVVHYQFEAIHPYRDGNGRIGRLLIPLFLYKKGLISYPFLYISEYFETRRPLYYANMRTVDKTHEFEIWLEFFLEAITDQSITTQKTALQMLNLYNDLKQQITTFGSGYAIKLLDIIFETPMVSFVKIKDRMEVGSNQTIYNLINKFVEAGILELSGEQKRNKIYVFKKLLDIVR